MVFYEGFKEANEAAKLRTRFVNTDEENEDSQLLLQGKLHPLSRANGKEGFSFNSEFVEPTTSTPIPKTDLLSPEVKPPELSTLSPLNSSFVDLSNVQIVYSDTTFDSSFHLKSPQQAPATVSLDQVQEWFGDLSRRMEDGFVGIRAQIQELRNDVRKRSIRATRLDFQDEANDEVVVINPPKKVSSLDEFEEVEAKLLLTTEEAVRFRKELVRLLSIGSIGSGSDILFH